QPVTANCTACGAPPSFAAGNAWCSCTGCTAQLSCLRMAPQHDSITAFAQYGSHPLMNKKTDRRSFERSVLIFQPPVNGIPFRRPCVQILLAACARVCVCACACFFAF